MADFYHGLYNLGVAFQTHPVGKYIYSAVFNSGLYGIVGNAFNKKTARSEMNEPTTEMQESIDFFADNKDRVDRITTILADQCFR